MNIKKITQKKSFYFFINILCFTVWIITMTLQIINPHPYRGLIGNLILALGILYSLFYEKINKTKSPLYNPDKKKHTRNIIVFNLIITLVIILVGLLFWKIF